MSSSESSSSPSPSPTNQSTIRNQEQGNPQCFSSQPSMDDILEYPSPTQFAPVQVPLFRKLPFTLLAPSKTQTSLPHRPSPLPIRKSHVQPRNPPSSESSLSSSEETSLASQKIPFLRPVPEAVSSHKKSAVSTDSPLCWWK